MANSDSASERPSRAEAEDFLRDVLAGGPRPTKEIEAEAKDAGISWRTIKRAKKDLGIEAYREASAEGAMHGGQWCWRLPKGATNSYEGHTPNVAPLEEIGPLKLGEDDR